MNTRVAMIGGAALLVLAVAAGVLYSRAPGSAPELEAAAPDEHEPLPIPPVPPRLAEGDTYERCLALLETDPAAAAALAEDWHGGDGARHCLALSRIALGAPAEGASLLDALAATSTAPVAARAMVFGQAAQAYTMAGDQQHALAAAGSALSLLPDDPDLLVDHANAAANAEHFSDAIDDLTHALDIDPRRADAFTARAAAWRHLGRLDQALDDIERALGLDPEDPDALLERGIIRQRRNDRAGARADWQRTIELAPDSPAADLAEQNIALLDAGPDRR